MRTIRMRIAYRGTRYHGFQRQPNAQTVQGTLEQQLSRVLNGQTGVFGCSRTDTGVHANEFVLHFHTEREIRCKNLVRALNGYLPDDISVLSAEDAPADFHARFDCRGKEYLYRIHCHESKNPFLTDLAFHYRRPLDLEKLKPAAQAVVGTHDFHSFCAQAKPETDCFRTIYGTRLERAQTFVFIFAVTAFFIIWCASLSELCLISMRACSRLIPCRRFFVPGIGLLLEERLWRTVCT